MTTHPFCKLCLRLYRWQALQDGAQTVLVVTWRTISSFGAIWWEDTHYPLRPQGTPGYPGDTKHVQCNQEMLYGALPKWTWNIFWIPLPWQCFQAWWKGFKRVGRREIENIRKHHVEQQVAPKGVGTIYSTPSFRKKVWKKTCSCKPDGTSAAALCCELFMEGMRIHFPSV